MAKIQPLGRKTRRRQSNHADANRPDHLQDAKTVSDVKRPGKVDDDQLDEDKPESTCEQEPGSFSDVFLFHSIQISRCTCQEDEYRRAEMRDPAREEEQGRGRRQIGWLGIPRPQSKIHPDVVQCHEDHHQPAQEIDGLDSHRFGACF